MHATVRSVIEAAGEGAEDVCILDTEASPEHLSRGTARYADAMFAVVEPYYKSLETGRRMALLARDLGLGRVALIANKIRDDHERAAVEEFADKHELEIAGVVPFDERLPEAERAQQAPLDFASDSPAVVAIGRIAQEVTTNGRA
jgi:CO dehydrogenase maturation factor